MHSTRVVIIVSVWYNYEWLDEWMITSTHRIFSLRLLNGQLCCVDQKLRVRTYEPALSLMDGCIGWLPVRLSDNWINRATMFAKHNPTLNRVPIPWADWTTRRSSRYLINKSYSNVIARDSAARSSASGFILVSHYSIIDHDQHDHMQQSAVAVSVPSSTSLAT